jgi:hypothetical protein
MYNFYINAHVPPSVRLPALLFFLYFTTLTIFVCVAYCFNTLPACEVLPGTLKILKIVEAVINDYFMRKLSKFFK